MTNDEVSSLVIFPARANLNWTDKQNAVVVCASMDMVFFTFPTSGARARRVVFFTLLLLLICVPARAAQAVTVFALRCEQLENPLGIDVLRPRLSWKLESNQRGQKQTAY